MSIFKKLVDSLGPLTLAQERDIAECFKLLDEDGSGALDIYELVKAFKMLGFKVSAR